jgi:hypothetical protein
MKSSILFLSILISSACKPENKVVTVTSNADFNPPIKVRVAGYNGVTMEPFIARDGTLLLFNNSNATTENTNLHWATKINDSTFYYKGEIAGVNTADLEGVPTLDSTGTLYFVSTRNYATTLSTLYQSTFSAGKATDVNLVSGVSKAEAGWVNFDVEVSSDGQTLYFVDARFNQTGTPQSADLVMAKKVGSAFQRVANSTDLLQAINTDALEYAACISSNQLELYFTRVATPLTITSSPEIFRSTRTSVSEPFSNPIKVHAMLGFVEAPTIAPDQKTLYYHKKENDTYVLYMSKKK